MNLTLISDGYYFLIKHVAIQYKSTVKSQFNEWPPSAHFDNLNLDFTLNLDFLMQNSFSDTRFCILNRVITLNRGSKNRNFTGACLIKLFEPKNI